MFGIVIAGHEIVSPVQVEPTKFLLTVPPGSPLFSYVTCFATAPFPEGAGALVYLGTQDGNWLPLGTLSMIKPSAVFRVFWPGADAQGGSLPGSQIGISLEPLANVQQHDAEKITTGGGKGGANIQDIGTCSIGLAKDLYNYLRSFERSGSSAVAVPGFGMQTSTSTQGISGDLVPEALNSWLRRVESKTLRDPTWCIRSAQSD